MDVEGSGVAGARVGRTVRVGVAGSVFVGAGVAVACGVSVGVGATVSGGIAVAVGASVGGGAGVGVFVETGFGVGGNRVDVAIRVEVAVIVGDVTSLTVNGLCESVSSTSPARNATASFSLRAKTTPLITVRRVSPSIT